MRPFLRVGLVALGLSLGAGPGTQALADPSVDREVRAGSNDSAAAPRQGAVEAPGPVAERRESPAETASLSQELLKKGFSLRKAGRCAEALPHFFASLRLLPQPKTLLNLADCEEQLGLFVEAGQHWRQAADLAQDGGDAAMQREALDRLTELAPRIPYLTIVVVPSAPSSSHVLHDGIDVASASLGVPVACDAGRHTIEVRAEGYVTRVFEVLLSERESKRVDVEPGPQSQAADRVSEPPARSPPSPAPAPVVALVSGAVGSTPRPALAGRTARSEPTPAGRAPVLYAGLAAGVLGVAGLGLGVIEGLTAQNDHKSALADCNGDCATSQAAQDEQSSGRRAATIANVGFAGGATLGIASIALFAIALAPSSSGAIPPTTSKDVYPTTLLPLVGRNFGGIGVQRAW